MLKDKRVKKLDEGKFMFISKEKLIKLTMSFMVTSFLAFTTIMPVSAADIQFKLDGNNSCAAQEEVQEDSFYSSNFGFKDDIVQKTIKEDGESKEIVVKPRSSIQDKSIQNGRSIFERNCNNQDMDEETPVPTDEDEDVDEEIPGQIDEDEDVDEEIPGQIDDEDVDEEIPGPIDEDEDVDKENVQNKFYNRLLNSYNRLLNIYEQLLGFFGVISTN